MDAKTKILEAALQVFAETGYRGATTRRIAQVADVNEVTLFRHYGSKDELIRAAVQYAATEEERPTLPDVPVDPRAELTEWASQHYDRMYARRAMIRTCIGECGERPEMAGCVSEGPRRTGLELKRYLTRLQASGLISGEADLDGSVAMLMSSLFIDAVNRDLTPDLFPFERAAAPAKFVALTLNALGLKTKDNGKTK
jgi:AcrR family transcriptional regulator